MLDEDVYGVLFEDEHIEHSWGKKPEQKKAEKEYNHEYYMKHKKEKAGKGRQLDKDTSVVKNFLSGGLIGAAKDLLTSDKDKEIADIPCNVLVYNEKGSETDPDGRKYIAKMKVQSSFGRQYWKYFYTDYQIQCYENLINQVTDVRDNSEQSQYLDSKNRDNLDRLMMAYDFKEEPCTMEEDIKAINPNYNEYDWSTSANCMYCTEAYMLRQMGFDVKAVERISSDSGESSDAFEFRSERDIRNNEMRNIEVTVNNYYSGKDYKELEKELAAYGDGAYGNIAMYWEKGGGHSIVWHNKDGKTYFIDTQDANRNIETSLEYYYEYGAAEFSHYRGDNQIPDGRFITDNVKPNKKTKKWEVKDSQKYKNGIFEKMMDD